MAAPTPGTLTVAASTAAIYAGRLAPGVAPNWFMVDAVSVYGLSPTHYLIGWPHAFDAAGVQGYQYSLDGGSTWISTGAAVYAYVTGRTAGATDQVRVRAVGNGGLYSATLSAAVTLPAAGSADWVISVIGSTQAGYPTPDFATPEAWAAAAATLAGSTNLVTANKALLGLALKQEFTPSFNPNSVGVELTGCTTDATHYRHLSVHPGSSYVDSATRRSTAIRYTAANGAAIRVNSSSGGAAVGLHEPRSRISRFQVAMYGAGGNAGGGGWNVHSSSVGGQCRVDECLLEGGSEYHVLSMNYGPHYVRNTFVINTRDPAMSTPLRSLAEEANGCIHDGVMFIDVRGGANRAVVATVARSSDCVFRRCGFFGAKMVFDGTQFTASISGTTMTVTAVEQGYLSPLMDVALQSAGSTKICHILSQLSGATGGVGTYQVSASLTQASAGMQMSGYTGSPTFVECVSDALPALHPGGVLPAGVAGLTLAAAGFVSTTYPNHDLRITSSSPLRGAATPDTTNLPLDIFGARRPTSGATDVGPMFYI